MIQIHSAVCRGLSPVIVHIESYIRPAKTEGVNIYGLASLGMKEGKIRITSSLRDLGFPIKGEGVINLYPANIKKDGSSLELAIALSLSQYTFTDFDNSMLVSSIFIGELSLSGEVRPCGMEEIVILGHIEDKFDTVFISNLSSINTSRTKLRVVKVSSLSEVILILRNQLPIKALPVEKFINSISYTSTKSTDYKDYSDVKGCEDVKRAMQVIAAGRHHSILMGPRGCGKTMLIHRLPTILPPMEEEEIYDCMRISAASGSKYIFNFKRPFREIHPTISPIALVGGGSEICPGEISLSHHGVLFLDELTEFKRSTIDTLRQPLESRSITISRTMESVTYPADFLFIAAFNPCPCGLVGTSKSKCTCSPYVINNYISRISSAILDRIDIQISMSSSTSDLSRASKSSEEMRREIEHTWEIQRKRGVLNSHLEGTQLDMYCHLDEECSAAIDFIKNDSSISNRGITKVIRIARTIADIEKSEHIQLAHIKEALSYRTLDKVLRLLSMYT